MKFISVHVNSGAATRQSHVSVFSSSLKERGNINVLLAMLLLFSGFVQASASKDNQIIQSAVATVASPDSGVCGVAPEESTNVSDLLRRATLDLFTFSNNSVSQEISVEHVCASKLSYVRNQADYLLRQLKLLKGDASLFVGAIKRTKEILNEFNELVESTKLSHMQPLSNSNDNFNTNLAALQQQVNSIFFQTSRLHGKDGEAIIKLCVAHIKVGEAEAALAEFNKLSDNNTLLDRIIREAYNHKRNPDNTEQLVKFAGLLPNCALDSIFYSALFDEMQKYGHLNKPELLTLYEGTKACSMPLHKLQRRLLPHVNNLITKWADKIRTNATEQIISFAEKGSLSKSALANNIPSLVTSSFSNKMSNFGSVLNFVAALSDASLSATAFSTLLSAMKKVDGLYSYEIVRLAYKMKEAMDFGAYDFSEENRLKFENLKNNLPSVVVGLIWNGGNCTAKNMRSPEYLYADKHFHGSSRRAFTWTTTGMPREGFWAFESEDEGQSFAIKNNYWNEYLFASDLMDSHRNWVLLSSEIASDKQGIWSIKPVDSSKLTVVNNFREGCLYAELELSRGHAPNSRAAFTWKGSDEGSDTNVACHWLVSC